MADAPKPKAPPAPPGPSGIDMLFWVLFVLTVISVISFFLKALGIDFSTLPSATDFFSSIFNKFQIFSVFFSLVFFLGIIYFNFKLGELMHHGHGHHDEHGDSHAHGHETPGTHDAHATDGVHTSGGGHGIETNHGGGGAHSNSRWNTVLKRMESSSEADWRLAIIEADIILSEMLSKMGYKGESIADKLKQVEESDFKTIQSAWSGHKIRNNVAHGGSEYHLSKGEAEKAISFYKEVFEEFYFI